MPINRTFGRTTTWGIIPTSNLIKFIFGELVKSSNQPAPWLGNLETFYNLSANGKGINRNRVLHIW